MKGSREKARWLLSFLETCVYCQSPTFSACTENRIVLDISIIFVPLHWCPEYTKIQHFWASACLQEWGVFSLTEELTWDTQLFFSLSLMHHRFIPAGQRIFLLLCSNQCWGKKCPMRQVGRNLVKLLLFSATCAGLLAGHLLMILQKLSAQSFFST